MSNITLDTLVRLKSQWVLPLDIRMNCDTYSLLRTDKKRLVKNLYKVKELNKQGKLRDYLYHLYQGQLFRTIWQGEATDKFIEGSDKSRFIISFRGIGEHKYCIVQNDRSYGK